jgi:electron transfer flavoprotein alpha subunit
VSAEILVVAEQSDGAVKGPSLQAMSAATQLAQQHGGKAAAVVAGAGAADAADALAKHGAEAIVTLDLDTSDANAWATAVAAVVRERSPAAVVLAHTARGKDLGPRLAGLLDAPMATDCVELSSADGVIIARRPVYAGKALVNVSATGETLVASLRPNAVAAVEAPGAGAVQAGTAVAPEQGLGAVLKEVLAAAAKKIELTEAGIIVSGGRGLKGPENFAMIEELAGELGAAVGASRAVVDAGWRPHADQVGQTGKTVSPQLYIAVAISGAIQHLAGMRTSKYIVAINKDPEAPIFKLADYGIVGDAFEVVPRLTEAVRALKSQG